MKGRGLLFRRKTDRERKRKKEGLRSACLLGKREIGRVQSLSLKGAGHPGDRAGQQNYTSVE